MKLKEYIFIVACSIGAFLGLLGEDTWISVIGVSIIYICCIGSFMYNLLRWNINKKQIKSEYVSIKIENIFYEIITLFGVYSSINDIYRNKVFYYKYIDNDIIEINNFKDFLNTYDGTEKVILYMIMGFSIVAIISIIKKIVCRGRVSSEQILFSNGEIIKVKDIEYIKVEDGLWKFSKKITITLETNNRVIYINNKLLTKVEKELYDTIANSNFV
ncbi:MAG: hypothetical protein RSE41_10725 [Clostridia bacterium]